MLFRSMTAICLLATTAQAEVPTVATDIAPIHSLVARVMQGVGEPEMVIQQGASTHGYSLRPSEARALQEADLVVWVGEELAPWLEEAIDSLASDAHSLELLGVEGTHIHNFREAAVFGDHNDHDEYGHDDHDDEKHDDHGHAEHDDHAEHKEGHDDHHGKEDDHDAHDHDEHGHEDHKEEEHRDHEKAGHDDHDDHGHDDHGHDHDGADPHAWLDPENAIVWLKAIAEELSELDPANAELYAMNAEVGATEIEAAAEDISAQLAPFADARFVVFHDAYQYFEEAFGLEVTGAIQLSDATAPSAARLVELQEEITEHGISCIFAEPQFNDDLVASVAPEGSNTGVLDPLASDIAAGPALYTTWLKSMAKNVADCVS